MDETRLLEDLRRGERSALERAIGAYTGYVSAVAARAAAGIGREDLEEVTADVFLALWAHALEEPEREIFLRRYCYGEKGREIAGALGLNHATVRAKLARGRKKLRALLEERGYRDE